MSDKQINEEACRDIKAAIAFYEKRGYDWLSIIGFLSATALGLWPIRRRNPKLCWRAEKISAADSRERPAP